MTDAELDALQDLADKATPGPWANVDTTGWAYPCVFVGAVPHGQTYEPGRHYRIAVLSSTVGKLEREIENAAFIAATRTAVPTLIAEVRRLRQQRGAVVEAH